MHRKAFILSILVCICVAVPININTQDDTLTSPDLPQLNVHVIAHTHDDVGWLKTIDEYYYGANQSIQDAGVQYILDTVIDALLKDPTKKFIYVEIGFFERWWAEQNEYLKDQVRSLVSQGRLEFINAGITMNDEACVHYTSVIDQMTEGHQFVWREFGVRPRIGWHIDPFGHAATQASLFAQMGFDGFFFGRIEYTEHDWRNASQRLEFIWRGSETLGSQTDIFAHVLYTDYCYIDGTAWEWGADPVQDDPRLFDFNVELVAEHFASQVRGRSISFRTNNVLIPFGCDFQFENAHINFKNMDKLLKYFAKNPQYGLNVFYSTPSIYLDAVYNASLTWEVRTGDFFPYADCPHCYWTGYFTSRPGVKGYERQMNNLIHATDKLYTLSNVQVNNTEFYERIDVLMQAFSIATHHDAVAGTEKQHVADDYEKRLYIGMESAQEVINEILGDLVTPGNGQAPTFTFCPLMNVSICPGTDPLSKGNAVPVVIYNHVAWNRDHTVRVPIPISNVDVMDENGNLVLTQISPNSDFANTWTLVFEVTVPPAGFSTYIISPSQSAPKVTKMMTPPPAADVTIQNDILIVTFSGQTNKLASITNKITGQTVQVSQDFLWWNASVGDSASNQASGAYIFRPVGVNPLPVSTSNPTITVNNGNLVTEVYQTWNSWVSAVTRLYAGGDFIEMEANVGPIEISDGWGKEVISRWTSSLDTDQLWYTDSQGTEFLQRRLNWRPWNQTVTEPIASNYYPMNAAGYIQDLTAGQQLSVITDRSRGASSLGNGQFENMIHRRLLVDDGRGVGEPLNETEPIRTREIIVFESIQNSSSSIRPKMLLHNNPPLLAFSTASTYQKWLQTYTTTFSPLTGPLPPNLELLNLRTLQDGLVIVRLHHLFAANEDPVLSQPVTLDLDTLFAEKAIVELTEMTLTANRPLNELHRLVWKTNSNEYIVGNEIDGDNVITINPMEFRTFLVRFQNLN